jgi:glycosyltransferase involved in cell wall biosynthesis
MKKIIVITDMSDEGSGYKTICAPLLTGLTKLGYDIKVAGLFYRGSEHPYPFSIIPTPSVEEASVIVTNLVQSWFPDIILVALDLPLQAQYFDKLSIALPRLDMERNQGLTIPRKYIAITPLENGPLTASWAAPLFNMDAVFFISELGKQEAIKSGITKAEHLQIGIDTASWYPPTPQEREQLRNGMGISPETFVVLTVADNQERKNLWSGMEAVSRLKKELDRPIKYIMVTREQSPYGWRLRDLAVKLGINQEYAPYERGMPQRDLWALYAISDAYLQPSKAEGLGLPVMEAMACGVITVTTDTGAMRELLEEGRGNLIPAEYTFTDVWGNSKRDMMDVEKCKNTLKAIATYKGEEGIPNPQDRAKSALEYIRNRTWDVAVQQLHNKIKELYNEQTQPTQ